MAEEALKKLEEQLKCAICLDTYTDPKLLQCFHVYCRECLVRLVVRDQQGELMLTCPTCRQITPIPAGGVSSLQAAFHMNELFDIRNDLKKAKDKTVSMEKAESCVPHPTTPPEKSYCLEHNGRELELYCGTCRKPICSHCVFKGQKHHNHEYDLISLSFERFKGGIALLLEPTEKQLESLNKSLVQIYKECGKISDQQATIEATIHDTIRQLQEALNVRKTELISQLHELTQKKLKKLAIQRDQIETVQAQLSSCLHFMKESVKMDSKADVLKITTLEKRAKELTTIVKPYSLKLTTEADMTFSVSPDIMPLCRNYGKIFSPGLPDPSRCHITGKCLEEAEVGEKSTALLQVINLRDELCEELIESLECELVSEISGTSMSSVVERKNRGLYEISYQPTIKGRHQLHIKINNQPIRGSPFTLRVKLPIEKLGTPMSTISGLKRPLGVALNWTGGLLITENDRDCVSILSSRGEKLLSFGTPGSAGGEFNDPHGVAVDSEGNILVVDTRNHRIQKFTSDGQFLTTVGTYGNGHLQFNCPEGITFSPTKNKVYVVEGGNHRVHVLNSDLTFSSIFGKEGSGRRQFDFPRGVACDNTGKVYVADTGNHRIQVFTAEGKFLKVFGKEGQRRGELYYPTGIAVDASGMVYISDENCHITVFTAEGKYLTSFGKEGSEQGELKLPHGLAVDSNGMIYVCDAGKNALQIFF